MVGWIVPVHVPVREYTHIRPLSLMRVCVPGGWISTSGFTSSVEIWMSDWLKEYEGMGAFVSVGCIRMLRMRWVTSVALAVSRMRSSWEVRAEVHSQESVHSTSQYLTWLSRRWLFNLWRSAVPLSDGVLRSTAQPSDSKMCIVSACMWVLGFQLTLVFPVVGFSSWIRSS